MNRRTHTRDSKTDSVLAPNTKVLVWSNLPPGHASSRSDGSPGTISITTSRDENTKERTAIIALRFDSPEHPTLKYEKKNWTACNPIENWDLKGIEKVQNELRHQNVVCLQIIFPDSCTADVPPSYSSTSKQRSTKTLVIVFDRGRGDQRKWDRFKSIAITNTTQRKSPISILKYTPAYHSTSTSLRTTAFQPKAMFVKFTMLFQLATQKNTSSDSFYRKLFPD